MAPGLHAQSNSAVTSTELPEVVVSAEQENGSLTVPSVTQAKQQLSKVPGGVGVVDAEDYKRGRASNLKDALDYAPGVFIQPRFGAEESRLSIRGSGIQRTFHGRGIKLLQDGVPLNLADGGFDMQAIEPLASRYIEVYRGANALQYGATTIGGAINFVSMTGHDASPAQARFEFGSFDTLRYQLSSGGVFGPMDYYASFTGSQSQGFRDWSEQTSYRFFSNVGFKINPNVETRFYITYVDTDSQLPGALQKEEMENNPQQFNLASRLGRQKRDFSLFRLANKTTITDDNRRLTISSFWSHKDLDHPIFQVIDQLSNDFGLDLRYDVDGTLFGHRNLFTLGTGATYGVAQDSRFLNVGGQRGALVGDTELQSWNYDFYLQNTFYLTDTVALVAGAQVSYANRDLNEQTLFGANNTDRQEYWGFSPKLALLWDITPQSQAYLNVSRSFEPPSFGELVAVGAAPALLPLDPQTATTIELGTRGTSGRFTWDFSYYYSWVQDELLALGVPGGPVTTANAGRTIHQGIELGLDVELLNGITRHSQAATAKSPETQGDRLVLRQVYLLNDFRFNNDAAFGDNQLPGIPRHYYRAELMYEHPSGLYFGPNVEWVPEKYNVDLARTLFADPYALLGFKIGYRSKRGWSAFVEARNLTDETYAATTGVVQDARLAPAATNRAVFFPGDGRSFYAGIEWKW